MNIIIAGVFLLVTVASFLDAKTCDQTVLANCIRDELSNPETVCSDTDTATSNMNNCLSGSSCQYPNTYIQGLCTTRRVCEGWHKCLKDVLHLDFVKVLFKDPSENQKAFDIENNFCKNKDSYDLQKWDRECVDSVQVCIQGLSENFNRFTLTNLQTVKILSEAHEDTKVNMFNEYCSNECKDFNKKIKVDIAKCGPVSNVLSTINEASTSQEVATQCSQLETALECLKTTAGECDPVLDSAAHDARVMGYNDNTLDAMKAAKKCGLEFPRGSYEENTNSASHVQGLGLISLCIALLFSTIPCQLL